MESEKEALQLVHEVLKRNEKDKTELAFLFANQSEEDELDELAQKHPEQFNVWYTADKTADGCSYSIGFINDEMIAAQLFPALRGPLPMINFACNPDLDKLNFHPDLRYVY